LYHNFFKFAFSGFLEAIGKVIKEQQGQQVDEDEDHIRERAKFIKDMRRILFFCKGTCDRFLK